MLFSVILWSLICTIKTSRSLGGIARDQPPDEWLVKTSMSCFFWTFSWLVVSKMAFIFHNIWDNPFHWLIFFKMVKTTNQLVFNVEMMTTSSTIVINRHRLELHRFAMVCKISQVVCFSLQKTGCWSRFWPAENPARSRQVSITPTRPISAGSSIDRPWDFAEKTPASRSILQCILLQWALPSLTLWERNDAAVEKYGDLRSFQ